MFQRPNGLNKLLEDEYNRSYNRLVNQYNTPTNNSVISLTTETTTKTTLIITSLEGRDEGMGVISEYIQHALGKAKFEQFDDGSYYAEIPDCPGVWANEDNLELCKKILAEALEDWILFKLQDGDTLPIIDGIRLRMEEAYWAP